MALHHALQTLLMQPAVQTPKSLVDAMTGDSYTVCKPSLGPCTWWGAAPVAST